MSRTGFSAAIELFRERLGEHLGELVGDQQAGSMSIQVGPPRSADDESGIDLSYLGLSLATAINKLDVRRIPGRLQLLVSIHGDETDKLDLLHDLLLALDTANYDHELAGDIEWWTAHGLAPRPSVLVDIPVLLERSVPAPPLVTRSVQVVNAVDALRTYTGRVLSDDGRPMVGARLTPVNHGRHSTTTDGTGAFRLRAALEDAVIDVIVALGNVTTEAELIDGEDVDIVLTVPTPTRS